ncbi:glycosyltransferase [Paenibacillus alkaliterrae]|uniref:glycosyltransferase family 2 protein n=1 Tax=Paenibacillus alkaliterrae TaxID=320909 RepID=UPI001F4158D2|nr:glycosyltransferase [Paenibacillus alkaliterrae]MCF2938576.1 glycosyltransferase [Paenibacillus alkaliterrae]
MPTNRSVAAIVSVMNEEATIVSVLEQLQRLPLNEIIVVVNGSRDRTLEKARQHSQAMIVYYPDPLGHDVGRAIGAKLSHSDILLFLDGDFAVRAEDLVPFIHAVDQGTDIALNNITPYLPSFSHWDSVTIMKRFLNLSLNRSDLHANSMTAVPHAMSRAVVEQIGYSELMVPPKAQVRAIMAGLRIAAPASVNVVSKNKMRKNNRGMDNPVARMIVGDHVEAVELAMQHTGNRLNFPDKVRKRQYTRREAACR